MPSPFLYSMNPHLKFEIYKNFYGHRHFVWCADCFDGRGGLPHGGGKYPPSSNPAELFAALRAASLSPLEMFKRFSEKFGEEFDIAHYRNGKVFENWRSKFIDGLVVDLQTGDMVETKFNSGSKNSLTAVEPGPLEVSVTYSIANSLYAEQLVRHGLRPEPFSKSILSFFNQTVRI
jgi:hypothetical protein